MCPAGDINIHKKYEQATRRPFGYIYLWISNPTQDRCRVKTKMLPNDSVPTRSEDESGGEALAEILRKESCTKQPPLVNEMSRLDRQMEQI